MNCLLVRGNEDAQVMRFEAGETDIISRLVRKITTCCRERKHAAVHSSRHGAQLGIQFLLFNLNDLSGKKLDEVAGKQVWFRDLKFRQAIQR